MSENTGQEFTGGDWELIQDCVVDQITRLRVFRPDGYEYKLKRLEAMLEKIANKQKQGSRTELS